jgi:hypothetical protein
MNACSFSMLHSPPELCSKYQNRTVAMNEAVNSTDRFLPTDSDQTPAARARSTHPRPPGIFSFLDTVGYETDEFGRRLHPPQDGFDGMTLTGASARVLGNGLQVSAAFGSELQNVQQHRRVNQAVEKLGELNQRMSKLNETLPETTVNERDLQKAAPLIAKHRRTAEGQVRSSESQPIEETPHPTVDRVLTHPLRKLDQQMKGIEKKARILSPSQPLQIDPNLSITQKIDRIETALKHLSDCLDRLEQVIYQEPAQAPVQIQQPKIEGVAIAEKLNNFVEARAKQLDKSPQEPVVTTLGKVSLNQTQDSSTLSIESDHYDEKFSATRTKDGWATTRNDLTQSEAERLLKLPQTPEEYRGWIASKMLISELQQSFPEQFDQTSGVLSWETENSQYQMKIHRHPDQSRDIRVDQQLEEGQKTVLSARITPDQVTEIHHSELNPDVTEYQAKVLRSQRTHESKNAPQLAQ